MNAVIECKAMLEYALTQLQHINEDSSEAIYAQLHLDYITRSLEKNGAIVIRHPSGYYTIELKGKEQSKC